MTTAATAQLAVAAADAPPDAVPSLIFDALRLVVPAHYDAAGSLAVAWYDELRDEAQPSTTFAPTIVSEPNTDWIERELQTSFDEIMRDLEREADVLAAEMLAEAEALVQKEVARGFRDTIDGNAAVDSEAIGWSRHARDTGCKFCRMLARDSVVYRRERSARFAAHANCHCVARPEFANGEHGPEANVYQYLASKRERTPDERAALRDYLNQKYPDAPG